MISYFTYYLTDFLSKFYPPGRLDLAQYGSLRQRYNKSGLRADKPVSFLSWYAEMILNSTRPWIWTEFSYFRLQLEFSSKISTYQVWFCIKIWANIVAGNRCIQICLEAKFHKPSCTPKFSIWKFNWKLHNEFETLHRQKVAQNDQLLH